MHQRETNAKSTITSPRAGKSCVYPMTHNSCGLREKRPRWATYRDAAAFLEGIGHYQNLFSQHPPALILQFTERVVTHKGRLSKDGSTATAYCLILWRRGNQESRFDWIAPCRKRLEADVHPALCRLNGASTERRKWPDFATCRAPTSIGLDDQDAESGDIANHRAEA